MVSTNVTSPLFKYYLNMQTAFVTAKYFFAGKAGIEN